MDDKLKAICRVLGKGLMAGGVYVLLWILVVRGHYVWAFPPSALIAILVVGILPVCLILLHGGLSGWGWSYVIAVLFSFFLYYFLSYNAVIAPFFYGPSGLENPDWYSLLSLFLFMAASKALTLLLMVITVLPPDYRAMAVSEKEESL